MTPFDADAETDEWPTPARYAGSSKVPAAYHGAIPATESDEQPESDPSPVVTAEGTREARYAEALAEYADLDGAGIDFTGYARAVMALADGEHAALIERVAELEAGADRTMPRENAWPTAGQLWHFLIGQRAERRLERLTELLGWAGSTMTADVQREAAEAEVRDLRAKVEGLGDELLRQSEWTAHWAAKVNAVVALAVEWTPTPGVNKGDTFGYAAERIRAALASVGRTEPAPEAGRPSGDFLPWLVADWTTCCGNCIDGEHKFVHPRHLGLPWSPDDGCPCCRADHRAVRRSRDFPSPPADRSRVSTEWVKEGPRPKSDIGEVDNGPTSPIVTNGPATPAPPAAPQAEGARPECEHVWQIEYLPDPMSAGSVVESGDDFCTECSATTRPELRGEGHRNCSAP